MKTWLVFVREVKRVLEATPDIFATLGLDPEESLDGKAARSSYKKIALKVHPDKAPEELKAWSLRGNAFSNAFNACET